MYGSARAADSIDSDRVLSSRSHFSQFCIRGALPIPSVHSFTTIALAAGDQGALWVSGIGPQVLQEIQNDKIVTQLRDLPVDCAYRDPSGVFWFATPYSVYRVDHERLDTIGSKPEAVTYHYHGAVPAGQGLTLRQLDLPTRVGSL